MIYEDGFFGGAGLEGLRAWLGEKRALCEGGGLRRRRGRERGRKKPSSVGEGHCKMVQ